MLPLHRPNHRRNALAAILVAAAAITALAGIAVDADETLLGQGSRPKTHAAAAVEADVDEIRPSHGRVFDPAGLGSVFDVAAPGGGVTASQDDTTVTVQSAGGHAVTINLNREQTYLFGGDARWFVGSDKPVAVFSGRDRRVRPVR